MTKIACAAVVKNEGPYIGEWLDYQFRLGFNAVLLLDNGSNDNTIDEALTFAVAGFDLRILDWPMTSADYQIKGFEHAARRLVNEFAWVAFFDIDEFLVLEQGLSLANCLAVRQDAAAIGVPWAIFGSAGHATAPEGGVLKNFCHRSDAEFGPNRHIKSIIRPSLMRACLNPHMFEMAGEYRDLAGRPLTFDEPGVLADTPDYRAGKLHHYFTRSRVQWQQKLQRGYHDLLRPDDEFLAYDRNENFDNSAVKFLSQSRPSLPITNEPGKIFAAVVLIVKNEVSDILAWIAWYKLLGFDTLIIFDDDSDDGTWEVLQSASEKFDIRLFRSIGEKPGRYEVRQEECYKYVLSKYKYEFEWLAFFDADEYLALFNHNSIRTFLDEFPNADSLSINWCNYGSSGHVLKPVVTPIEAFTWHSREQELINRHVKAIVRPDRIGPNWMNVHCFDAESLRSILTTGERVRWGDTPGIVDHDPDWQVAKLMHFQCRSMEHFVERIRKRPDLPSHASMFRAADYADVQDLRPLERRKELKSIMAAIEEHCDDASPCDRAAGGFAALPVL